MRKDNGRKKQNNSRSAEKRQVLSRIFLLFAALAVAAFATYAWMAANREVESKGMSTKMEVTPNLVISKTRDGSDGIRTMTADNASFIIEFNDGDLSVVPTRHNDSYTAEGQVRLEYNTNPEAVDIFSGLKRDEEDLAFAPVTVDMNGAPGPDRVKLTYYHDYEVYIASLEEAIPAQDVSVGLYSDTISTNKEYLKACSIDFYLYDGTEATYIDTLNLAGYDWESNDQTEKKSFKLFQGSIPLNTEGDIHVLMRLYFDGGLLDSNGHAFINSADVRTDDISLKVTFVAENSEET